MRTLWIRRATRGVPRTHDRASEVLRKRRSDSTRIVIRAMTDPAGLRRYLNHSFQGEIPDLRGSSRSYHPTNRKPKESDNPWNLWLPERDMSRAGAEIAENVLANPLAKGDNTR